MFPDGQQLIPTNVLSQAPSPIAGDAGKCVLAFLTFTADNGLADTSTIRYVDCPNSVQFYLCVGK